MDNSNINNFQRSIWKQTQDEFGDDWKLFFDVNAKEKTNISKTTSADQHVKLVNYTAKKNLILGTPVMTPSGIGRLVKQDKNLSTVKLMKTNEDVNFEEEEILINFPLYIRVIDKEFSNWHKIFVPTNGNVSSIRKCLEERKVVEMEKFFTLVFNTIELKEETFFDQLDLRPESKILLFGLKSNQCKLVRFTKLNSWWYTYATDGISFSVNKQIKLSGLGMYGSHEGKIQLGNLTIHEGNNNTGVTLFEEAIEIPASPSETEPIVPIKFKKPITIKAGIDYTLQFHCTNYCYFYYGSQGKKKVFGDSKVEFEFKFTNGSNHGSSAESGNFPEFYYFA